MPKPRRRFFSWTRPLHQTGMALPGLGPSAAVSAANTTSSPEDPNKKVRKPYTITKSRESWTDPEHDKFLEALQLFDRDWKKIEAFIGSKTVIQIRSHAQKYFLKVQKNGTSEHLPPPRPKRKASHPYPQKAPKNGSVPAIPQISRATQSSSDLTLWSPLAGAAISSPTSNVVHTVNLSNVQSVTNNCCSSTESTPGVKLIGETTDLANHNHRLRVLPDFAQVYSFIGSVFDTDATDHLQKLKKMDRIDVETVLLLMRNLSINLTSPDFEDHRRLLSSYEIESETINLHGATTTVGYDQPQNVA